MCSAAISDLALPVQCPASIMLMVLMTTGADDNWCQVEEVETSRETALENKAREVAAASTAPVVAAASTGDQPKVPQVEALDAGEAEALAPPVAAVAKQLQPVMETVGSVVKELEEQELQQVAVVESQQVAMMEETKAVAEIAESDGILMPGLLVIQSYSTTSQAKNAAENGPITFQEGDSVFFQDA